LKKNSKTSQIIVRAVCTWTLATQKPHQILGLPSTMHPLALNDEIENNYYKLIVFTMQNTPAVEVQN